MPEPIDPRCTRPAYLQARASIAADLYAEGKISRAELHRLETDAELSVNSGPVEYLPQWGRAKRRSETKED